MTPKTGVKKTIGSVMDFRPISIMGLEAKLYHTVVAMKIEDKAQQWMEACNTQYTRKGRQSLEILRAATNHIQAGNEDNAVVCFDFRKAFDCIPHEKLIHKISHIIDEKWANCIATVLQQTRYVVWLKSSAVCIRPTRGLPQGSSLSPLLFNFYVSERTAAIPRLKLFVDDATILTCIANLQPTIQLFQQYAERLQLDIAWDKSAVFCNESHQRKAKKAIEKTDADQTRWISPWGVLHP